MIIDARQIDRNTEIETDLCIIGAGAAGITIAKAFDGKDIRVCLIESGGLEYDALANSLYRAENIGHLYWPLDECQFRAFGGNTNCWGGWCRPLDELDFRSRSWIPDSGWPFNYSELGPYYGPAHKICQIPSDSYVPEERVSELADRRAQLLPVRSDRLETLIYRFSPPTRFRHVYFDLINNSNNIKCLLHANVTNIETTHDAREIARVAIGCLNGNRLSVRAKIFVLATGGTENPRLLLNSRNTMSRGLGNEYDLVGRFFMEHPHTRRRIIPMSKRAPVALYGLHYYKRRVSARLRLTAAMQEREGLLNYSANIHHMWVGSLGPGWLSLRKIVLAISPSRRDDPFLRMPPYGSKRVTPWDIWQIARNLPLNTLGGFLQLFQPESFVQGYILESKSEQAPNRDSRIILQSDRDPFGLNLVSLDWRTLPIDRHTVIRAEEIVEDELRRLNIGTLEPLSSEELVDWPKRRLKTGYVSTLRPLSSEELIDSPKRGNLEEGGWQTGLEGGWHQLGTTRMNDDPRKGVVDRHCRVHGISNLFIGGGSVFPTVGSAPPTLTIIALAVRLSEHLMQQFGITKTINIE
jgi:choline dehydrogenase-like flavoprotein